MKLKLSLLLVLIITYSWSQTTKTFLTSGSFTVPPGVTTISVQAWGGGGSGGGAVGAGLLFGRGGAGGGGGGYASSPLTVTPGTTLNVIVAGQTSGNSGANGSTGFNSTILGYEFLIFAAGGSGGGANNAGGTPMGGAGGITNSTGTVTIAGFNGFNGNSWSLLSLLLSSGAGGAGANFGGAGGPAVPSLILGNAPGNAGSSPGGGGSGAINSALGTAQVGGVGAAGKVIISYTCPTYNVTATTAADVCASTGTSSAITLVSSAVSLPIGNYTVTYNRSSPSATALTANLTVTTAGTGTFTATGLNTVGSSMVTITNIASDTCSSNITSNNTVTINVSPATIGGSVSGGTTINLGTTSALLTLSGHRGSVLKWQSAVSPFSAWTDIVNSSTTYISEALTETTQFRAVVQSGNCTVSNSAATTVTVNALPTIALSSSAQTRCSTNNGGSFFTILEYTATTGSPITYSIAWDSSPANSFVAVTDAALTSSPIEITVPAGIISGTYTGRLTVKNAIGAVSTPASAFTVTVNETPSITSLGIINAVCMSLSSQNAILPYSGVTGNPTSYYIDWNGPANEALLEDQPSTEFAFDGWGDNINTIVISANVPTGTYNGIMYISNGICIQTQSVSITINAPPTITGVTTNGSCFEDFDGYTTLNYDAATGDPTTYSIAWNSSPANNFTPVTDEQLYSSLSVLVPANTPAGTYSGTITVKNANGCVSSGTPFTLTVRQISITTTGIIDTINTSANSQNATLTYAATTGNPINYFIFWDSDTIPNQPVTPFTFAAGGGILDTIEIPANVPAGTYTGRMFIGDEATCTQLQSISIIIQELPTITTAAASTTCLQTGSTTPETYGVLSYSATTGSPVTYSIVWSSSPANSLVPVTDEVLSANPKLILIPIASGTNLGIYTGTITVKDANGVSSLGSNFNLRIGSIPTIATSGTINSVTTSSSSQNAILTYSSTTGSPSSYSIDWNSTANTALLLDQSSTPFVFNPSGGTIDSILIPANVPAGTYSGVMNIVNDTSCNKSQNVSITINPVVVAPSITLTSSAIKYCLDNYDNAHYKAVPYSATTGNPVTYSIVWDSSPTNDFTAVTDAALPANAIQVLIPLGTASDTYTGTLTVKNANGDISSPSIFTIKVGRYFTISTSGTIASVATSTNSQNATLSYSAVEGNISNYNIDWDATANAALLTDQGDTPFTSVSSGGTINTIQIPANVPAGTYNGTMYLFDGTCGVVQSVSIVINGLLPTIALASSTDICLNNTTEEQYAKLDYKGTTGNPTTYSIVWSSSPGNNLIVVTDAILPASPISIAVPNDTLGGTYTGTLTVKDANGVNSLGKTFNLNVGVAPSITIFAPIRSVCSSTSFQNATLEYSEITGNPTSYYIDWDETANAALLQDQSITSYEFEGIGGLIESIEISANVPGGSYSGTMYLVEGACTGSVPVSIEINSTPAAPIIGEIMPVTDESRSTVSVSGLPRRTEWTILISPSLQTRTGFGDSVLIYDIPVGTSTLTVSNFESTCASEPSASFVIVDERSSSRGVEAAEVSDDYTTSVTAFNQVINIETINQTINEVLVYDVSGNLLYNKDKVSDSKLIINSLRSSNQVLVVKVVLNNNRVATKKVIY
ncbi:beta strand repeat-containing protein [Flavobacterium aquidurense]|uniref:Galactose binding lectin domain-containing protein n=1 Tax=Flavobacterium aquidurense TaxID=362413 RepID=A0A0Q0W1I5_9FLAO|nr:T9SS sorting signal type C domain-containing protein [Flavobacterium aquidurense]KQB40480.1 Galactose binding lectin domain-containing protein [Flavobacterium aquidurense]